MISQSKTGNHQDPPVSINSLLPLTPDIRAEQLAELKRLFPDLLTNEGRLPIKRLRELSDTGESPFFIYLERSPSTSSKWNLNHFVGNHFNAF